ncbi:hypothetical protein D3C80_1965720 [compost metagenome]
MFELAAAVTAEHRMGVAVDQARSDPGPREVMDLGVIIGRQLATWTDPLNVRS